MAQELPKTPRQIDPEQTFLALSKWIETTVTEQRAPGLIIGLSGTDSILTFLAAAKALENLGRQDRLLGVHYCTPEDQETGVDKTTQHKFRCVKDEFNWVVNDIYPWLKQQAPQAKLEIDHSEGFDNDHIRWGRLFSRAVANIAQNQSLANDHYFTLGTRNATEDYLGTYSQISKAVSMQPLIHIYKSEVLQICEALGVPQIALDKSREVDCDCGRFDTAAHYLEEVDAYIMKRKGELSGEFIKAMPRETQTAVMEYVLEEEERNRFRDITPYRPSISPVTLKV